ncbi:MAG TPA: M56 family metallopeptidase [Chitinophagaceae bacterium]|jgi:hypothetical protein|nr:M56 family metallopeptidase [Chitinophagaceae bacterium]
MPLLFVYLLKLSLCLAMVYGFYHFVLRRLTFYQWNRWYLLGYSFASFFLPLVNLTPVLQARALETSPITRLVPLVEGYAAPVTLQAAAPTPGFPVWAVLAGLLLAGMVFLAARLGLQYLSFLRLKRKAVLLSDEGVRIYHLEEGIAPFSFGNAIFLNQGLHEEGELKEILLHEFIHVRERHTVDILFCEALCLLNWFNPFAWLVRSAVRQNLEYIADSRVLQKGMDKKQYQYLLLKVMGETPLRMAPRFNFSSLKKRMIMMNKTASARIHLTRFLFLLPLCAVLLLAFRKHSGTETPVLQYAALVIDAETHLPVAGVAVRDEVSGRQTETDANGYYSFRFPAAENVRVRLRVEKAGYRNGGPYAFTLSGSKEPKGLVELLTIRKGPAGEPCTDCFSAASAAYLNRPSVGYPEALAHYAQYLESLSDTVPPPPPPVPAVVPARGNDDFFKRNPSVRSVHWKNDRIILQLKNGKDEQFDLSNSADMRRFKEKYGKLPVAPPPPPAPPEADAAAEPAAPAAITPEPKPAIPARAVTPAKPARPAPPEPARPAPEGDVAPPPPPAREDQLIYVQFPSNQFRFEQTGSYIVLKTPAVFLLGGSETDRMEVNEVSLQGAGNRVVLDGKWLEPGKAYAIPAGQKFRIAELSVEEAQRKYGGPGRQGAIELRSLPSAFFLRWMKKDQGC